MASHSIYGATGSMNLADDRRAHPQLQLAHQSMLLTGMGLPARGLRVQSCGSAVPHVGAGRLRRRTNPDHRVHGRGGEGRRVRGVPARLARGFDLLDFAWLVPVWWLAAVTMVYGNVVALSQRNIKRMLAYSSIVPGGLLLVAIAAGTSARISAFLFFLVAYTSSTIRRIRQSSAPSAGTDGETRLEINDLRRAVARRGPGMAAGMAVCMLALARVPFLRRHRDSSRRWYMIETAAKADTWVRHSCRKSMLARDIVLTGRDLGRLLSAGRVHRCS